MVTSSEKLNLARRYRPQELKDVQGQALVVKNLTEALKSDRIAPAYLFSGPRGVGKTSCARIFARAAACTSKSLEERPCGKCASCEAYAKGKSMDLIEIDGASHTGVDDVRRIIESVVYKPNIGKRTVYIIDEVHMLSNAAFNALLKTLEEPPPHLLFLFATTESEKIPATILSRVQRLQLKRLSSLEVIGNLQMICTKEKIEASKDILERIATATDGSLRDAQTFLDQLVLLSGSPKISESIVETFLGTLGTEAEFDFLRALATHDIQALLQKIALFYEGGKDLYRISEKLLEWTRGLLILKAAPQTDILHQEISVEHQKSLLQIFQSWNVDQVDLLFEILWSGHERMKKSEFPRYCLETTLIRSLKCSSASIAPAKAATASPIPSSATAPTFEQRPSPPPAPAPRQTFSAPASRTATVAPSAPASSPMAASPVQSADEFLLRIKKARPSLHALLVCAQVKSLQKNLLRLEFSKGHFAFKQLSESILKKELDQIVQQLSGKELLGASIEEMNDAATRATKPSAPPPASATAGRNFMSAAKKVALDDPTVQEVAQILGAEVESVTIEGIKSS